MNKLFTCASLAAIGAVGLQAQYVGTAGSAEKSWSISARLRGFFDDNYATLPGHLEGGDWAVNPITGALEKKGPTKRGSWGTMAGVTAGYSPNISDLTTVGVGIRYDMYYYEDRPRAEVDHNVQATGQVSHQFSERYKVDASDSFVVAQEPNLLDPTPMQASPLRSEGSNIRNTASFATTARMTAKLVAKASYGNTFYDYEQDTNLFDGTGDGTRSALLDKMIQSGDLQVRWEFRPDTTGALGYRFDYVDMTSKDRLWTYAQAAQYAALAGTLATPGTAESNFASSAAATNNIPTSSIRDNYSHYIYLGFDHDFSTYLSGQVKVGGQYTVFPNARERYATTDNLGQPTFAFRENDREKVVPYADVSLRWAYAKDSQLQLGFIHSRNSTDVAYIGSPNDLDSLIGVLLGEYTTLDQESSTVYGAVTQSVTAKLRARLRAQWQGGSFNQKNLSGKEEDYVGVDVSADYEINKFLFAEVGYGYDLLVSDIPDRGFTRNRVFVGIRGTY